MIAVESWTKRLATWFGGRHPIDWAQKRRHAPASRNRRESVHREGKSLGEDLELLVESVTSAHSGRGPASQAYTIGFPPGRVCPATGNGQGVREQIGRNGSPAAKSHRDIPGARGDRSEERRVGKECR